MKIHFKNPLFGAVLLAAISWLTIAATPVKTTYPAVCQVFCSDDDPVLTVIETSATSVSLSWDAWEGSGPYTVTVTNQTTHQVEQSFQTHNTSTSVSNLTTGDTYRFSVAKNGFVITEDVIM